MDHLFIVQETRDASWIGFGGLLLYGRDRESRKRDVAVAATASTDAANTQLLDSIPPLNLYHGQRKMYRLYGFHKIYEKRRESLSEQKSVKNGSRRRDERRAKILWPHGARLSVLLSVWIRLFWYGLALKIVVFLFFIDARRPSLYSPSVCIIRSVAGRNVQLVGFF